jgi:protein phosphatase
VRYNWAADYRGKVLVVYGDTPEYLRIIYGSGYLLPENLERLKSRAVGAKRSLASREFALGVEALECFVRKEPLRRTHECVFAVLAL